MSKRDFEKFRKQDIVLLIERYEEMIRDNKNIFFEQGNFEKIIDFYEKKNEIGKALQVAEIASSQHPFSALILAKKAELLFDMEQPELAIRLLNKAEIFDPGDINIYLQRADIYSWLSKYSNAIDQLKKALPLAEKDELDELYLEFADIYDDWGKFNRAFKFIQKALKINPKNKEALTRLNFFTDLLSKQKAAIDIYSNIIDEDPYNWSAWNQLAATYHKTGDYDHAVEAFEYAIAIDDKEIGSLIGKAGSLFELGLYEKAIDAYLDAIAVSSTDKTIHLNIGLCYEKLDDNGQARNYFNQAIKLFPEYAEAHFMTGYTYFNESNWAKAKSFFKKALSLDENNPEYLSSLGKADQHLEEYETAIRAFTQGLEINPKSKQDWIDLAQCYYNSGENEKAVKSLNIALEHFDNDIKLTYIRSAFLFGSGKKSEGIVELEKALLIDYDKKYYFFIPFPELIHNEMILTIIERHK